MILPMSPAAITLLFESLCSLILEFHLLVYIFLLLAVELYPISDLIPDYSPGDE
jgi:hypothetical protein